MPLTLNDSQQNDNDKEEECDIKQNPGYFIWITVSWFYLITDTPSCSHSSMKVEHKALQINFTSTCWSTFSYWHRVAQRKYGREQAKKL